jgi:hypothetical protein
VLGLEISSLAKILVKVIEFESAVFEVLDEFPWPLMDDSTGSGAKCIGPGSQIAGKVLIDSRALKTPSAEDRQQAFSIEGLGWFWSTCNLQQRREHVDMDGWHIG